VLVPEFFLGLKKRGWRGMVAFIVLSLLLALHVLQWPAYLLLCGLFLALSTPTKPSCNTAIFGSSPFAVLLSNQQGQCCYVNQKWCVLTGLSLQDALGDGWLAAIHPEDQGKVLAMYAAAQQGGLSAVEYRFLCADGRLLWVSSSLLPMPAYSNVAYLESIIDLTELKGREIEHSALLIEQNKLKEELESILSSSIDPIVALNMEFKFSAFNKSYASLFFSLYGVKVNLRDCLLQYELKSEEDRSNLITFWGRALQGESFVIRRALHGDDQVARVFDLSFSPQLNSAGEQVGAINVLHDVTLSAQTEGALQRSRELFKVATQSSVDAIYVLEAVKDKSWKVTDFEITKMNPNGIYFLESCANMEPSQLLGQTLHQINYDYLFDVCCDVFENKNKYIKEEECSGLDKKQHWLLFSIVPISNGVVLTVSDISERKRSELALATFSSLQQAILDSAGSAIIVTDLSNTIRLFNQAAEKILGYPASDLIGKKTPAIFHQTDSARVLINEFEVELGAKLALEADVFSIQAMRYVQRDWVYQHRDGHAFPVELTMNVVRNQQDEITGYMGIANDISVRKQAEIKLQQSEYRISAILDSLHDCILSMGFDGVIRDANPAALRVFAYDDLVGESLSLLFPLLGTIDPKRGMANALSGRLGVNTGQVSEVIAINKAGNELAMDMGLTVVEVDGKRVYIATLHDLTQHKIDEEKMQETIEELEAVQANLSASHEQLTLANQELSRLAHMDGLTGLANRRLFDQTLTQEWARAARDGKNLALVMLDVDFFKRYNDYFGHQAGDECLKRVATAMVEALHRPGDFVARYGGEEFVLILPSTDQQGAVLVVEEVLSQVRNLAIVHQTSDAAKVVTLSAGIAVVLPLQGIDPCCLVEAADQALYQAKHLGRNRYFVAGDHRPTE
jgi:diguanylate cyclase (GGDEF)-like protein/PAS domain S-box-containing protein